MRRLLTSIVVAIAILGTVAAPVAMAQSSVPVDDRLLTIIEGDGWSYLADDAGDPVVTSVPMMIDGEPQLEFAPDVLDMYQNYGMQDAYAWSADLVPANYEPIATTIEIRVLSFATEENATGFLGAFYDQLVEATQAEANLTPIDPLPESELELMGVTRMQDFTDYASGDSMGMAGGVRYLAQVENIVISVDVAGPLVDYNFDLAYWLLEAQADCATSADICEPTTMPMGDGRWELHENGLGFSPELGANYEWARWLFPLEAPVTAPEVSVTLP